MPQGAGGPIDKYIHNNQSINQRPHAQWVRRYARQHSGERVFLNFYMAEQIICKSADVDLPVLAVAIHRRCPLVSFIGGTDLAHKESEWGAG